MDGLVQMAGDLRPGRVLVVTDINCGPEWPVPIESQAARMPERAAGVTPRHPVKHGSSNGYNAPLLALSSPVCDTTSRKPSSGTEYTIGN